MKILVVGAGALGGYFGGRLALAGRDVTFLVREGRAAELAARGLVVHSPKGDFSIPAPVTIQAQGLRDAFDVVLLSCKAYDLDSAIEAFAPAVGPGTMIVPLLNGMRHLDVLAERFHRRNVMGGQCLIAATLDAQRDIRHLNDAHRITFGEMHGGLSDRVTALTAVLSDAGFDVQASDNVLQDMWEKWVFLASLASATCLMRASLGDILAVPAGESVILSLFRECAKIANEAGYAPRPDFMARTRAMLTATGSPMAASMLRDIQANARIEAEHIIGDLLRRRAACGVVHDESDERTLLEVAHVHLLAYEALRAQG